MNGGNSMAILTPNTGGTQHTGYTMEQYRLDLKTWRKETRIITTVITLMTIYGVAGVYMDTVYGRELKWSTAILEISWFLAIMFSGVIARGQPDGSRVDGANMRRPAKGLTAVLVLVMFLVINAVIIGAAFALAAAKE